MRAAWGSTSSATNPRARSSSAACSESWSLRSVIVPNLSRLPLVWLGYEELEDVLGHGAHLAALVGNLDFCTRPQVLLVDLGDCVSHCDSIADKDRPYEPDAVIAYRDGGRLRLLDHERGGRGGEAYRKHAVGDALLVGRLAHNLLVDVVRTEVARDAGEQVHV